MRTTTTFDSSRHHIYLKADVDTGEGLPWSLHALLDTDAPRTEVSDRFLSYAGLLTERQDVALQPGLQTQKYGKLVLPELRVCGQVIPDLEILVSSFQDSCGVDALIGLDFFRRFLVTIDYDRAVVEVG